jgi:hypothetical protein
VESRASVSGMERPESSGLQPVLTVRASQFVKEFHRLVKIFFQRVLRVKQTASWVEVKL